MSLQLSDPTPPFTNRETERGTSHRLLGGARKSGGLSFVLRPLLGLQKHSTIVQTGNPGLQVGEKDEGLSPPTAVLATLLIKGRLNKLIESIH